MKIEHSDVLDELVELLEASDEAHAGLMRLQEELGNAAQWTDEQHVTWRDAWEDAREPWWLLDTALEQYAEDLGMERDDLEALVKEAAGHAPLPDEG
ncbi:MULTISPECIES: hypothetical protein [Streptomyces]|uniref:Uncharacterized protein n=1 Tax=Streptomyces amritsarensis TaxID=681158 RepID=A0ABX3FWW4_9ACTN|nr:MULTISPECIES: hypothetical protein [Streptomyces]MDX6763617.1 hypothetical protein [Streptomyces sp. F8]OLZ59365.1 hypothetical protein AVW11_26560 [Streptomyces amritsarensis]